MSVRVPTPDLVSAPVVAVLAPDIVNVTSDVATSIVEVVPAVNVKFLLVEAVSPVYCKVPPPKTKLDAVVAAAPKLPETSPFPIDAILKVPPLIVVTPV